VSLNDALNNYSKESISTSPFINTQRNLVYIDATNEYNLTDEDDTN
ncbi:16322_t:CDS:2, partial [Gigaspora margarita]